VSRLNDHSANADIAKILADHHQALRTVVPSWENRPQRSHATKEVSLKGRAPAASASSSTNAGSQSQQTQAVSRSAPEAAGESSETVKPSPDTRRTPSNAPGAATATSTEKPSTAGMRGGASSRPSAEDFLARSPFHGAGPSTGRTPSIQDTVLQQSRPGRELLGNRAISSGSTAKRELLSDSKPTEPSPSSHSSQELMLNAPPVKVSTIRDPPPHLAHRESSIPAQQPQITKQSNGARELLPSSTASSSARRLIPAPSSPAPSPSPSLAERLGMAPPSQTKRPRDDPPLSDDSRPSLLSRLSSTDAHPDSKRSRGDPTEPQKEAPSLLSRMGRVNGSNGLSTPRAAPPASLDSAPSLSIRNRTIPLIAPQGASILNQSISSKPRPIISQNEAPPTPATPLLIRNHSQPPLSTSLSIRNHSTAFPATPTPDEEVVVRKGRGFREVSPEDVVMSVPIPVPDPVQVPVRGALRRPGPMMSGSFGRGR